MAFYSLTLFVTGLFLLEVSGGFVQECPGPKSGSHFPRRASINLVAPTKDSKVSGTLKVTEYPDGLLIRGDIFGLDPGKHGFHVHMFGNTSNGCLDAGPHFNPKNKTHGSPNSTDRHVGDLGNVKTPHQGPTKVLIFDTVVTLDPKSDRNILNRAIVVHEKVDDLGQGGTDESKKTGNAGKRLACGVVVQKCSIEFGEN